MGIFVFRFDDGAGQRKRLAGVVIAPAVVAMRPEEVMATLEKLGDLKAKGILTEEEFTAKKTELLKKLL